MANKAKKSDVMAALEETMAQDSPDAAMDERTAGAEEIPEDMEAEQPENFIDEIQAAKGNPAKEREIMINTINALTEEVLDQSERLKALEDMVGESVATPQKGPGAGLNAGEDDAEV